MFCSHAADHLNVSHGQQSYLLAVRRRQSKIDNYYIGVDNRLVHCQAASVRLNCSKAHFVFNLMYDDALVNFYTFVQTTIYNIAVDLRTTS